MKCRGPAALFSHQTASLCRRLLSRLVVQPCSHGFTAWRPGLPASAPQSQSPAQHSKVAGQAAAVQRRFSGSHSSSMDETGRLCAPHVADPSGCSSSSPGQQHQPPPGCCRGLPTSPRCRRLGAARSPLLPAQHRQIAAAASSAPPAQLSTARPPTAARRTCQYLDEQRSMQLFSPTLSSPSLYLRGGQGRKEKGGQGAGQRVCGWTREGAQLAVLVPAGGARYFAGGRTGGRPRVNAARCSAGRAGGRAGSGAGGRRVGGWVGGLVKSQGAQRCNGAARPARARPSSCPPAHPPHPVRRRAAPAHRLSMHFS